MVLRIANTSALVHSSGQHRGQWQDESSAEIESTGGKSDRRRFTVDGSDCLEHFLAQICQEVGRQIQRLIPPSRLEAVLLGGGYGRGEGGVLQTVTGELPYNDLEFYVFIRGNHWQNERRCGPALHEQTERLSVRAGIHVELKILSLAKLRRSPVSMFYYDLMSGHRCVVGEESLFRGCAHHTLAGQIPMAEATLLLLNRFSGVLLAREELDQEAYTRASHDFIVRNLAKAKLALSDALLTMLGQYHWSCRERHRRLQRLTTELGPHWETLRQFHAQGVEFKLHPRLTDASWAALRDQCAEIMAVGRDLWLWLESQRLRRSFASVRSYALDPLNKCPETRAWRNRLINAKLFGPAYLFRPRASRHPRERLLRALPVLLWEAGAAQQPDLHQLLRTELGLSISSSASFVSAYRELWRKFN